MIIWISSYPKSGNTWLRSFIASLLYSKDGNASLDNLHYIDSYPLRKHFKNYLNDFYNFNLIKKNWIISQELINHKDNKVKFLKTHHINCKIGEDEFTNKKNTLGALYIVRDPRNVITSIKYHFSLKNYDEALDMLLNKNHTIGIPEKNSSDPEEDNNITTFISSWATNYNSWKNTKDNFMLIRYEDLIDENKKEFFKIAKYLEKIFNISIDDQKIKKAIKSNSFENLKKLENIHGFDEQISDKITQKNKNFFYLGKKNRWQDLLDKKYVDKIEKEFKVEMKELNYI